MTGTITITKTNTTLGRALLEAQRQKAVDQRTAAEKKILALNAQIDRGDKVDFKLLKAQQESCEFFDQQVKAFDAKLSK